MQMLGKGLGPLNLVSKHLAVALGAALAEPLATFTTARHDHRLQGEEAGQAHQVHTKGGITVPTPGLDGNGGGGRSEGPPTCGRGCGPTPFHLLNSDGKVIPNLPQAPVRGSAKLRGQAPHSAHKISKTCKECPLPPGRRTHGFLRGSPRTTCKW